MTSWTINRQILSWMLIVAIIPLLLLTAFYLYSYDTHFKKQAFTHLNHIADYKTTQINDYISERIRDAQLAAQLPSTREALKILVPMSKQGQVNEAEYQRLKAMYRENLQSFDYYDVFLISTNADVVLNLVNVGDSYINLKQGLDAESYLAQSVNDAFFLYEPYLSNFSYYTPSKELAAFIAVPVLEKGLILGVLAFQIDTQKMQAVVQDATGLGITGAAHIATIYNKSPFFITHQDEKIASTPFHFGIPMKQAFKGISGSYITEDRKGNEVLAISRYLSFLHAGLVVKIDRDEALRELDIFWAVSFSLVFLLLSLVACIAFFLSRSIARPISALTTAIAQGEYKQELHSEGSRETQQLATSFNQMMLQLEYEKTQLEYRVKQRTIDLSQKEQNLALTLNSIGDAVISTGVDGRISGMNPIAEQLTGWSFADAKGNNIKQVFNIVESTTRESVISSIEQVLLTGEIIQLNSYTTLISKQGCEFHIADTAAPIRSEDNEILGMVLVFNDVTETVSLRESEKILAENISQSEQHLRLYREQSPIAIIEWDINCEVVDWNKSAEKIFGYTLTEVQGHNFIDLMVPSAEKLKMTDIWNTLVSGSGSEKNINEYLTKDGRLVVCEWYNTALKNSSGVIIGAASLVLDITERQRMEGVLQALAESGGHDKEESVFQLIVRQLALAQGVRHALIAYTNPITPDIVDTLAVWENGHFIDNLAYPLIGTPCQEVLQQGSCFYPGNVQALFPEDKLLAIIGAVSYLGVLLKSSDGKPLGFIALLDDKPMHEEDCAMKLLGSLAVRAAAELERKLAEEKLQFAARIFNETHEGITLTDAQGIIIDINPGFSKITGYSRDEVIGKNPSILSSGKQSKEFYAAMWKTLEEKGCWQGEVWNRNKNGEIYAQLMTISTLLDDNHKVVNYVGLFSDITLAKQQQKSLELMAHYDVLTGLPNRTLFADRFSQAIAHSKRKKSLLAVCFIDLDEFKPVNDTYGHDAGDQVLVQVAHRIKECIREQDTVSRIGGDEFSLLLGDVQSIEQCEQAMVRIHQAIAMPYLVNGLTVVIAASSGMTIYPLDNVDLDTLIRHADSAMYQAKLLGRNRYHLFDATQEQSIIKRHAQLNEIEAAFSRKEFCLYYQPKVNMLSGEVYGAEALIRWVHPEKGVIFPLDFLPYIEGTALEINIGNWVIDEALKQLDSWRLEGVHLQISVNISALHLLWKGFISQVDIALARYPDIPANLLQLEILESSVISDVSHISDIIRGCRNGLGVSIALDDFGTGYSSLTHLRRIPVNTIKIDRSFVQGMLDDASDSAIIEGIIGLAKAFDRDIIAEGVETKAHGLMLIKLGCILAQGYGIARPMPPTEFREWLKALQPSDKWVE